MWGYKNTMNLNYARTIRPAAVLCLCGALCCLVSCATSVKFEVKHPPLVDLRGVRSITVIPLEWNYSGDYPEFAADVTDALSYGIRKTGAYTFIDPARLKEIDRSRYREYVDVFVTGEITGVSIDRNVEMRNEKSGDETMEKRYTTVTTTVSIAYDYIRASTMEVLERFRKTETSSAVFENTGRRERSRSGNPSGPRRSQWGMFRNRSPSRKVAQDAISGFSYSMSQEILPWTSREERRIIQGDKKTEPLLREAAKLVRKKKYREAYEMYYDLYENANSVIAGYNMSLLLQAEQRYGEALRVLEYIYTNLTESGRYCPDFILNEIMQLRKIMRETALLNDYYLSK